MSEDLSKISPEDTEETCLEVLARYGVRPEEWWRDLPLYARAFLMKAALKDYPGHASKNRSELGLPTESVR